MKIIYDELDDIHQAIESFLIYEPVNISKGIDDIFITELKMRFGKDAFRYHSEYKHRKYNIHQRIDMNKATIHSLNYPIWA